MSQGKKKASRVGGFATFMESYRCGGVGVVGFGLG
jgi:hypothetical protein